MSQPEECQQPTAVGQEHTAARKGEPQGVTVGSLARRIQRKLQETEQIPLKEICTVVAATGLEPSKQLLKKALTIEKEGGMMTADGTRRRSVGGIWFHLVKQTRPRKVPTGEGPLLWSERAAVIAPVQAEKGSVARVKLTLVGRPGPIVTRENCVVTTLEATAQADPPKGLPKPATLTTTYTLYIRPKQWKRVAEKLTDEANLLSVEGLPTLDRENQTIAVLATNVAIKKKRQPKGSPPQERAEKTDANPETTSKPSP